MTSARYLNCYILVLFTAPRDPAGRADRHPADVHRAPVLRGALQAAHRRAHHGHGHRRRLHRHRRRRRPTQDRRDARARRGGTSISFLFIKHTFKFSSTSLSGLCP